MNLAKIKDTLPEKPSELIMLALSDLVSVRSKPDYHVDMEAWVSGDVGACRVCLAGAVMVNSLNIKERCLPHFARSCLPYLFRSSIRKKLLALNVFRTGNLRYGLKCLGKKADSHFRDWDYLKVTPYSKDPELFLKDMTDIANCLAIKGL